MTQTIDTTSATGAIIPIGSVGENNALTLTFTIDPQYASGNIYLDFQLPDGSVTETPALVSNSFTVPDELLIKPGTGLMDVVYKLGAVKKGYSRICDQGENLGKRRCGACADVSKCHTEFAGKSDHT